MMLLGLAGLGFAAKRRRASAFLAEEPNARPLRELVRVSRAALPRDLTEIAGLPL